MVSVCPSVCACVRTHVRASGRKHSSTGLPSTPNFCILFSLFFSDCFWFHAVNQAGFHQLLSAYEVVRYMVHTYCMLTAVKVGRGYG